MTSQSNDCIISHSLDGTTSFILDGTWNFPGSALSASILTFQFGLLKQLGASLHYSRFVLVWNPEAGAVANKVRLIYADDGPTNITEIVEFSAANYTTPKVDGADITTIMQGLLAGGVYKHIGIQVAAQVKSPVVYQARIENVWE